MAKFRIVVFLFLALIVVNCALARSRGPEILAPQKRGYDFDSPIGKNKNLFFI